MLTMLLRVVHVIGLLLITLTSKSYAHAHTYTLHHRIGTTAWSKRGLIRANPASASTSTISDYIDLTGEQQPWSGLSGLEGWSEEIYQLALTPNDVAMVDEATAPMAFARVCHLTTDSNESLTLHTDPTGVVVVGLSYELPGLNEVQLGQNGCPTQGVTSSSKQVSVQMVRPQDALSPLPPLSPASKPDGTPLAPGEEPQKEQSFFRKYWFYILPVVVLMLVPTEIADSNNEETEGGGDSTFGSGGSKAGRGAAAAGGSSNNGRKR